MRDEPRAKPLSARDLHGPSRELRRALERFAEASSAFDAACEDRSALGAIDARYAELAACAADVVRRLLEARDRAWAGERVARALERRRGADRVPGDESEEDVEIARLALRAWASGQRPA